MNRTTDDQSPIGVLLAQLGTPAAPTAQALRPYLRQFLSDPRVVDLNPFKWWPILHLLVLTRRPARSARLYRRIWEEAGSPLLLHSQRQVAGVQKRLGDRFRVTLGMRYGAPSINSAVAGFRAEGIARIVVFSMFPQFSSATTGSVYDAVYRAAQGRVCPFFQERRRFMPALHMVPPYYDHPAYISCLEERMREEVSRSGEPERYLITFHGIPARFVAEGDPYRKQCEVTAHLLAEALGLEPNRWISGFQSRFGKEEWLQPYTEELLLGFGATGGETVMVTCPGFTADCLETLDEIGTEGNRQFAKGGGRKLTLVPCLNSYPPWLDAMADKIRCESGNWLGESLIDR